MKWIAAVVIAVALSFAAGGIATHLTDEYQHGQIDTCAAIGGTWFDNECITNEGDGQ